MNAHHVLILNISQLIFKELVINSKHTVQNVFFGDNNVKLNSHKQRNNCIYVTIYFVCTYLLAVNNLSFKAFLNHVLLRIARKLNWIEITTFPSSFYCEV